MQPTRKRPTAMSMDLSRQSGFQPLSCDGPLEDYFGQLTRSAAVFFEVFFYFEGGHAAGAGGGDGLAVAAVLDVSAGEDAGDDFAVESGEDVVLGENVAVGVEVHHAFEGKGIG